jgi:hypothetical protein
MGRKNPRKVSTIGANPELNSVEKQPKYFAITSACSLNVDSTSFTVRQTTDDPPISLDLRGASYTSLWMEERDGRMC